jgi:hypothetical protein
MMAPQTAVRLAWSLFGLALTLFVVSIPLHLISVHGHSRDLGPGAVLTMLPLGLILLGALIVSRQPRNAIGWIFTWAGVAVCSAFTADAYISFSQANHLHLPGIPMAAWYENLAAGPVIFGAFAFLFLLFPDGHVISPRWRPVAWITGAATVAVFAASAFKPGPLGDYPAINNPFGLALDAGGMDGPGGLTFFVLMAGLAAAAVSLVLRFRRSRGEERQQLKLFATATVFSAILLLSGPLFWFVIPGPVGQLWNVVFLLAVIILPAAIGVAMLKYRLYEIDVIINRALVYGSLTVTLGLLYVGGVIALQTLARAITGQTSDLAIAVVTLAVAALFNPWRYRVQRFIDRRFYRHKYDASRTLAALSTRLRDEVDLDQMAGELTAVVQVTMQPTSVSLWLAERGRTS